MVRSIRHRYLGDVRIERTIKSELRLVRQPAHQISRLPLKESERRGYVHQPWIPRSVDGSYPIGRFLRHERSNLNTGLDKPEAVVAVLARGSRVAVTCCQRYIDHLSHCDKVKPVFTSVPGSSYQFLKEVLN